MHDDRYHRNFYDDHRDHHRDHHRDDCRDHRDGPRDHYRNHCDHPDGWHHDGFSPIPFEPLLEVWNRNIPLNKKIELLSTFIKEKKAELLVMEAFVKALKEAMEDDLEE